MWTKESHRFIVLSIAHSLFFSLPLWSPSSFSTETICSLPPSASKFLFIAHTENRRRSTWFLHDVRRMKREEEQVKEGLKILSRMPRRRIEGRSDQSVFNSSSESLNSLGFSSSPLYSLCAAIHCAPSGEGFHLFSLGLGAVKVLNNVGTVFFRFSLWTRSLSVSSSAVSVLRGGRKEGECHG